MCIYVISLHSIVKYYMLYDTLLDDIICHYMLPGLRVGRDERTLITLNPKTLDPKS